MQSLAITSEGDMVSNEIVVFSKLPVEDCWKRVAAQADGSSDFVGPALSSQIEVVPNGDQFELRHRFQPAVFTGSIHNAEGGSNIRGPFGVPCRGLYAGVLAFVLLICAGLMYASAYDLLFGTHKLLTRSAAEAGIGHPASRQQHFQTFIIVPLLLIPTFLALWPKVRQVSAETWQATKDFLDAMFATRPV